MGEPLVLVPGLMGDARVFMPQILELTKTHPVQIAAIAEQDTIADMALSLLENAPERFAIAGLGLGGDVVMEVIRKAPERVIRVAYISTSAIIDSPTQSAEREPQIARALAGKLPKVMREIFPAEAFHDGPARPQILDLINDMAEKLGPEVFQRQSQALARRPDQHKTLKLMKMSALVIGGAADSLVPPSRQEFLAEMIPHSTVHILPDAGHFPTIEAAQTVNKLMSDWMEGPLVLH